MKKLARSSFILTPHFPLGIPNRRLKHLLLNEEGQATTEYILLMAVVVVLFSIFKKILGPILFRIGNAASLNINSQLGGNLHYFRIGH